MRIDNILMPLSHSEQDLLMAACMKACVKTDSYKIIRKSVDARHKKVRLNYSVLLNPGEKQAERTLAVGEQSISDAPIIVGMGPAGLFAGYYLAKHGFKPIIVERGSDVDKRKVKNEAFWSTGILDPNCNMQFGEGGAGTFSDGKLTTRINDVRCDEALEIFAEHGAPQEILYENKPHIGTDNLVHIVKKIRESIIAMGGKVLFDAKVDGIKADSSGLKGVFLNGQFYACSVGVFAIGHSARDTYQLLAEAGVGFQAKSFAIGVRIEHKQADIDQAMYGEYAGHPALGSASYQLAEKFQGRGCFSFCMCPGGMVVASSSDAGEIVTNGMSYYARDLENANSALLVGVSPLDFGTGIFDGIAFQKHYEQKAYGLTNSFAAPVQRLGDFISGVSSTNVGRVKPSYTNGYHLCNLTNVLPGFVVSTIAGCMADFNRRIKGFAASDAILTGVETRSSSPVTMVRDENGESVTIKGLYPCGEGAGYAGGIVSAAVDGIKVAEKIIAKYKPFA